MSKDNELDEETLTYINDAISLPSESRQRLISSLLRQGLIGLYLVVCRQTLRKGLDSAFLLNYARGLQYIGKGNDASYVILSTGWQRRDAGILSLLVQILCDDDRRDEATALVNGLGQGVAGISGAKEVIEQSRLLSDFGGDAPEIVSPIFVVNLPQDKYRKISMEARLDRLGLKYTIERAVRADDVPQDLAHLLRVDMSKPLDGSFGNQLSQYKIWRKIAQQDAPYGIVIEDDAFVLSSKLAKLDYGALTDNAEIVFFNDRFTRHTSEKPEAVVSVPLDEALARKSALDARINALGSDGYALSRSGAQKLVAFAEKDGFRTVGTDWYLVSRSVSRDSQPKLAPGSVIAKVLESWVWPASETPQLAGSVLTPPLVEHRPFGIWRSNRVLI